MYCQVEPEQVIAVHNVPLTYLVPVHLEKHGLIPSLNSVLHLDLLQIKPEYQKHGERERSTHYYGGTNFEEKAGS